MENTPAPLVPSGGVGSRVEVSVRHGTRSQDKPQPWTSPGLSYMRFLVLKDQTNATGKRKAAARLIQVAGPVQPSVLSNEQKGLVFSPQRGS